MHVLRLWGQEVHQQIFFSAASDSAEAVEEAVLCVFSSATGFTTSTGSETESFCFIYEKKRLIKFNENLLIILYIIIQRLNAHIDA